MIYIKKGKPSRKTVEEIDEIKRSPEWKALKSDDTKGMRNFFDSLDKQELRKNLLAEQHYLCGYCMRRIEDSGHAMSVEHINPLSAAKENVLDYENMLGVCDGGRHVGLKHHEKRVLCCDANKGDEVSMNISPYDKGQMLKIRYTKDGEIYTDPADQQMDYDINYVLNLNGLLDKNGNRISDTATQLVKGRRDAYRECESFFRRLDKAGKCTSTVVQKRIIEMQTAEAMPEYVGVKLFFLEKKYQELKKRERSKISG